MSELGSQNLLKQPIHTKYKNKICIKKFSYLSSMANNNEIEQRDQFYCSYKFTHALHIKTIV